MRRGKNPETIITGQIREILKLMRVEHTKNWGGPMSERGVSDIIGTLQEPTVEIAADGKRTEYSAGRSLYCEIKVPGKEATEEQTAFLDRMRSAEAVCIVVHGVRELLSELSKREFKPAERIAAQLIGGTY